jgi:hypothetical protein
MSDDFRPEEVDELHKVPPECWDAYYYVLGKFMHEFARTETSINAIILCFVNNNMKSRSAENLEILQALIGEMRMAPLIQTLKRLLRVVEFPEERQKKVSRILDHLSEIQFMRDRLAHHGATAIIEMGDKDGWFQTTNSSAVRGRDKSEHISFRIETIREMTSDLEAIPARIGRIVNERMYKDYPTSEEHKRLQVAPLTWRYKPSQLVKTGLKHMPNLQLRGRRSPPSQE